MLATCLLNDVTAPCSAAALLPFMIPVTSQLLCEKEVRGDNLHLLFCYCFADDTITPTKMPQPTVIAASICLQDIKDCMSTISCSMN